MSNLSKKTVLGLSAFLSLVFIAMSIQTLRIPEGLYGSEFSFESPEDPGEDPGVDPKVMGMTKAQSDAQEGAKMSGLQKTKKFPECASTRRLEHPGLWDGPRVQYIHNPKAGGTSIQLAAYDWSRKAAGASFMKYDSNSISGSSTRCPGLAMASTIVAGHRGFGYCQSVENSPRGLFTFTAFRDAVSRVVSWYDYNLYRINEKRAAMVYGKDGPPLAEIVKRYNSTSKVEYGEQLLRYAGQQQARFICGYECMGPNAVGNKRFTEEYILERALANLEKLDVVGLTEEMNRMILQLKFHLPNLIPKDFHAFKRDNSNGKKSVLDDESRAILRQWAWVDDTLYKAAKVIYEKKQKIAEHCLRVFGELDEKDALNTAEGKP